MTDFVCLFTNILYTHTAYFGGRGGKRMYLSLLFPRYDNNDAPTLYTVG